MSFVMINKHIMFVGVAKLSNVPEHISGFVINITEEEKMKHT